MLINEARRRAGLTKKAIEYYVKQGLVTPAVLENGYREFSAGDVERLIRIAVHRGLELNTGEIKAVLDDETGDALHRAAIQKGHRLSCEREKCALLDRLCGGADYLEISERLDALERSAAVVKRLFAAFPGYYGRFICLHFARFLDEPVTTEAQREAYASIISFLDNVPELVFPEDLQAFLDEYTSAYTPEMMNKVLEGAKKSMDDIEGFIYENKAFMEEYIEYRCSDAFNKSLPGRLYELLKAFNSSSGYYDVFIPAMKKLSASYARYCEQMEKANARLAQHYPHMNLA